MSKLDDLLNSTQDAPENPILKWVQGCRNNGDTVKVAVHEDKAPFGSGVLDLVLQRHSNGEEQQPMAIEWDDEINAGLMALGVRATDLQQEGLRFSQVLRSALRKVERKYGDGFMNGVFVDLIDESHLGKSGAIGKIRSMVHSTAPDRNSRSYEDCRDAIAVEIGARAKELRENLVYGADELKMIMESAIARYLDERFSISRMLALGWIDESGSPKR